VLIVMENKEYGEVIGSPDAPYLNSLARRYTLATDVHAVTHPSLPNYLALIGGSTFGITSDCTDCRVDSINLVDQLERKGVSWKAYMEDLPRPCFKGAGAGAYAEKHDPFMYFQDVRNDPRRCAKVAPFGSLQRDLSSRSLPQFAFISPGLCNDTHDCPVSTGDRFLRNLIPQLVAGLQPNGLVIVTYDEGSSDSGCCGLARGGHIAAVIAGPGAPRRTRLEHPLDLYSILRYIEDNWGLGHFGGAAASSTPTLRIPLRSSG
jgi:hypothetical protein